MSATLKLAPTSCSRAAEAALAGKTADREAELKKREDAVAAREQAIKARQQAVAAEEARVGEVSEPVWFPKIQSGGIRVVRQNQSIIRCEVADHPLAWDVRRRSIQVAAPA